MLFVSPGFWVVVRCWVGEFIVAQACPPADEEPEVFGSRLVAASRRICSSRFARPIRVGVTAAVRVRRCPTPTVPVSTASVNSNSSVRSLAWAHRSTPSLRRTLVFAASQPPMSRCPSSSISLLLANRTTICVQSRSTASSSRRAAMTSAPQTGSAISWSWALEIITAMLLMVSASRPPIVASIHCGIERVFVIGVSGAPIAPTNRAQTSRYTPRPQPHTTGTGGPESNDRTRSWVVPCAGGQSLRATPLVMPTL